MSIRRLGKLSAFLATLGICFSTESVQAQRTAMSVDFGGVALRYADSVNAAAATVTPDLRFDWPQASAEAVGALSQFTSGAWSSQGTVSTSVFTPSARGLFLELAGFAGGSYHQDGTRTGEAIANGRLHLSGATAGVFAGGGAGTTWDGAWRRLILGEFGAWTRVAQGNALLTVSPVSVDDSTRYADGQISLGWTATRLDLSALGGYRWGSQLPVSPTGTRAWASFTATAWATPVVGIVAAAGTYPVDPTQGFPGGRFVSLGIRLASARRSTPVPQNFGLKSGPEDGGMEVTAAVDSFGVFKSGGGRVMLRAHAPFATRVEISGDFTGWIPVQLERTGGGWWSLALPICAGQYQMNMRIDGKEWVVPPGLLSMKDEFGGTVGLLVVE